MRISTIVFPILLIASVARAGGGVLEINQTCASETGCFAGDTPGFPVTIDGSAGKSYRLSSDLAIATDVNGIEISSSYVTLDLGGFEIAGPGSCTGTGATLSCGGVGSGVGVVGFNVLYGVTVRNGIIRNMRLDGIGVGGTGSLGVRIEGITARHNARIGISGQDGVLARDCIVVENGGNGFDLDAGSIVQDSIAIGNFNHGVEIDDAGGVVSGTTSQSNGARGINADRNAVISGNTVYQNGDDGIFATINSIVSGNATYLNGGDGIQLDNAGFANGNNAQNNTTAGLRLSVGTGFRENVSSNNGGGNVISGVDMGGNSCNGQASC